MDVDGPETPAPPSHTTATVSTTGHANISQHDSNNISVQHAIPRKPTQFPNLRLTSQGDIS